MREKPGSERLDDDFRRPIRIPEPDRGRRVLVALHDSATRIDVTAGLVLAGYHVCLASTLEQLTAFAGAVDVVVAEGRLIARLGRTAYQALRRAVFIAVCEQGVPTPLGARVRFTPPFDVDALVAAVVTLGRQGVATRDK